MFVTVFCAKDRMYICSPLVKPPDKTLCGECFLRQMPCVCFICFSCGACFVFCRLSLDHSDVLGALDSVLQHYLEQLRKLPATHLFQAERLWNDQLSTFHNTLYRMMFLERILFFSTFFLDTILERTGISKENLKDTITASTQKKHCDIK